MGKLKILLTLLITTFLLVGFTQKAHAAAVSWTGGDGDWETDGNWSGGLAPGADDDVLIDADVTVTVNATTTINSLVLGNSGETTSPTLNFDYDAATSGALILDDSDLTTYSGSNITHTAGTSAVVGTIFINVQTGDAILSGDINVDYKGYSASNGTGKGQDGNKEDGSGGAGHGGTGGDGESYLLGGAVYGSITAPLTLGSGGGSDASYSLGGAGGGLVKFEVAGELSVSGSISSNGDTSIKYSNNRAGAGGAGGSIYIDAYTITGNGSITANGGNGADNDWADGGGGGGGRIAIHYTEDNSTLSALTAYGGDGPGEAGFGGAGTIYMESSSQTDGDLIIDNNDQVATGGEMLSFRYGITPLSASYTFDTVTIRNEAELDVQSGEVLNFTTLIWNDDGILTENGTVNFGSSLTVPQGATYNAHVAKSFTNLTVEGVITHYRNGGTQTYDLDITVSNNLNVNSTGSINVDAKGHSASTGTGQGADGGTDNGAGGGGHGGEAGDGDKSLAGGIAYGSIIAPVTLGSGGGNNGTSYGGGGGGAIKLDVGGILTVTGSISANGENSTPASNNRSGGGGGGGSIYIETNTLAGGGSITANGGNGASNDYGDGGGGGGGRIALYYTEDNSTLSTFSAYGGNGPQAAGIGGAGTLYIIGPSHTYGDLIIDNYDQVRSSSEVYASNFGYTPLLTSHTFDTVTIRNQGEINVQTGATLNYTTLSWSDDGIITEHGTVNFGNTLTVPQGSTYNVHTPRTFTDLTIQGDVAHYHNRSTQDYDIDLTVSNDLYIDTTGSINVDYRGYPNTIGIGKGNNGGRDNGGGGGAHGGDGGNGESGVLGGSSYGSSTAPITIGSGGGNSYFSRGGYGGGAVKLTVGSTLTVNGIISANGEDSPPASNNSAGGGGGGGSIYITTYTLAGNQGITANGGDGANTDFADGGGGGGGRIAIYYYILTHTGTRSVTEGFGPDGATDGEVGTLLMTSLNSDPDLPTSLGPTQYVDGSYTSDSTPSLQFTLSDPDTNEQVKYQVQIDDDSGFSTPAVDYTSPFDNEGIREFTVGQSAGSGTYTTGSPGQTLDDASYYWRVKAIDDNDAESSYTTANSGGIAFKVKTSGLATIDLSEPASEGYISGLRPTFKWKTSSDDGYELTKYKLFIDNGDTGGSFTVDDIPVARTSSHETNKYIINYEGFNDGNNDNNYISVYTKSSTEWGNQNNGELKEGKRPWRVTVVDVADNETSEGRNINLDITKPYISDVDITPYLNTLNITGKISDTKNGSNNSKSDYIRSDPERIEVLIEQIKGKKTDTIATSTFTLGTFCDYTNITTNTLTCIFNKDTDITLKPGTYKITLTGYDKAGNSYIYEVQTKVKGGLEEKVIPIPTTTPKPLPISSATPAPLPIPTPVSTPESVPILKQIGEVVDAFVDAVIDTVEDILSIPAVIVSAVVDTVKVLADVIEVIENRIEAVYVAIVPGDRTQISDVKISQITKFSALINWKTNHPATSKVNYGTSTSFELGDKYDPAPRVNHEMMIEDLPSNSLIYFEVISEGRTNSYDAYHTFRTEEGVQVEENQEDAGDTQEDSQKIYSEAAYITYKGTRFILYAFLAFGLIQLGKLILRRKKKIK